MLKLGTTQRGPCGGLRGEIDKGDTGMSEKLEKADYALFCLHKSLQSLSPALGRISRLCGLLRLGEKDGKNTLPDIITHNESRMALKHLARVKSDVDDAYQEILSILESTKEPWTGTKTESVGQDPGEEGKS